MFNHPMRRCTTTATISLATATGSACTSIWRVFYNRTSQEASGLKILTVMITCRSVAPVVGGGPIDNDLRMVHVETSRWTEMHRHSVPNSIFCIAVSRHPQVTIVILGLSPVADGNGRYPLLAPAASRRTSEKA